MKNTGVQTTVQKDLLRLVVILILITGTIIALKIADNKKGIIQDSGKRIYSLFIHN